MIFFPTSRKLHKTLTTLMTRPARRPPRMTRPVLILATLHLHGRVPLGRREPPRVWRNVPRSISDSRTRIRGTGGRSKRAWTPVGGTPARSLDAKHEQ